MTILLASLAVSLMLGYAVTSNILYLKEFYLKEIKQ